MRSQVFGRAALAASMLGLTTAQGSVPKDLTAGFADSGKELQVSFSDNAVEGFADGTTFQKNDVGKEPTFALGDSSGISTTTLFTIIMVDTTDENERKLHYARSNFKSSDIVNIETQDAPLLEYKAPGAFGETGDDRQYTFLMYTNPARKQITSLKMPADGEAFDVKQFESDNGFQDASAGLSMTVKLGGQSSPGGSSPGQSSSAPESSSAAQSSSAAAASSAVATSATSATGAASQSATAAPSSAAGSSQSESSAAAGGSQSGASSTAAGNPQGDSSSTAAAGSESGSPSTASGGSQTSAGGQSSATDLSPASTALLSSAAAPSASTVQTSVVSNATASTTGSGAPALSTGAGASMSLGMAHSVMIGSVVAFAGVLAWY